MIRNREAPAIAASIALLGLVGAVACTPQHVARTVVDPALTTQRIRAIAILPIHSSRISVDVGEEMNQRFFTAFVVRNPAVSVVSEDSAASALGRASLLAPYDLFLRDYAVTAIPDRRLLKSIGKTLNVDAIVQGALVELIQRNGFWNIQNGSTMATVRYRIIATETGALLWEGTGSSSLETLTQLEKAPRLRHAIALAEQPVLDTLPRLAAH